MCLMNKQTVVTLIITSCTVFRSHCMVASRKGGGAIEEGRRGRQKNFKISEVYYTMHSLHNNK